MLSRLIALSVGLISSFSPRATAFDNNAYSNVATYWGQNANGGLHPGDTSAYQQRLSYYCGDDAPVDIFPLAFLSTFFAEGGMPSLDLANICSSTNQPVFDGTSLPNCTFMASDIQACQAKGKIVTLSLGGATASTTFQNDTQAEDFAQLLWNMFLGGTNDIRPFGDAVLDGFDLDLEGGGVTGDIAFVNKIRSLMDTDNSKTYYVTAAPQCPYPDLNLQSTLNVAQFDAVYVQFYNNACGLPKFNTTAFNYGVWDVWANTVSPNKNIKVLLGAPGSQDSAGSGYVPIAELEDIVTSLRSSFPNFGGVMYWDLSTAYANGRMDKAIKNKLTNLGTSGFTYPKCGAAEWKNGSTYNQGDQVTYQNYIWEAVYWVSSTPSIDNSDGSWAPITACGTGSTSGSSSTSTSTKTSGGSSTTTTACKTCSTSATGLSGPQVRKAHCVVRPSRGSLSGEL